MEDLDVDDGGAAVVAVVLEFLGAHDAVCAFDGGEGDGGVPGDAGDDRAGVEDQDGRVDVDGVWVEDLGERERREHGVGEVRRERVFVRAVWVGVGESLVLCERVEGGPALCTAWPSLHPRSERR